MTFFKDENGQSIVEYALILGFIAISAIIMLIALGPRISQMFAKSNEQAQKAVDVVERET